MATLVSTGQITIIDNNDAKPITAYITASGSTQQVYSKDESTVVYTPNWVSTPLVLTAKCYVGSVSDIASQLVNKKWSTDLSTSLGSAVTLTLNTNFLTPASPNRVYYFEGDYVDPATGLSTHVISSITLTQVQTGTNAVYVLTRGKNAIEEATGSTKNAVAICADLIRVSGIDTTGVTYAWFEANSNTQITQGLSGYAGKYGMKSTAAGANPTASNAELGIGVPLNAGAVNTNNTLVIGEAAVQDMAVFRVEVTDADAVTRLAYFTIYDISDPYETQIISSTGDKLPNGTGSTVLTPTVFNGSTKVASLTNWYFYWYFYNKDGNRSAFIDTTKTALVAVNGITGGRNITAHTTGATATITFDGAAITWAAGDLIKVVSAAGVDKIYEISTVGAANTVTLRTPVTNTWLNYTTYPAPVAAEFVGGGLFACTAQGRRGTAMTGSTGMPADVVLNADASITVTGDEIDIKGRIFCESNRP